MNLAEQLVEVLKEVNANDAFFDEMSKMLHKMYMSLQVSGFTPDQAMQLVGAMSGNLKPNS